VLAHLYPTDPFWFDLALYLTIGVAVPVATLLICWGIGRACRRSRNGLRVGMVLMAALTLAAAYGFTLGIRGVRVRRVTLAFSDLPPAFDGYRLLHASDLHVGSYKGWRAHILAEAIDSIMAQRADMIALTGDLQNARPTEIEAALPQLRRLKANDGVFSVLGNHDYPVYIDVPDYERYDSLGRTVVLQRDSLGWQLLMNSRRTIRRGNETLTVAGMENDGEGRFPCHADLTATIGGLSAKGTFIVMMEHDPTSWRRTILPHCHAQLTLSGHTHGGQLTLLGMSPAALRYREWGGMYHAGERQLSVTTGVGGLLPFRIGVKPEIVVITLKRKRP